MPVKEPVRALPASPPLISLLTSAEVLPEQSTRWEGGIAYESEICGTDRTGVFPGCDVEAIVVDPGADTIEIEPMVAWAADSCSPAAARDWEARARRKLASCESSLIESELWRGTVSRAQSFTNKYLASNDAIEVAAAPVDPAPALACLEQALSSCNCGVQGMIHATPQVITYWISANLVYRDGSKLYTHLGTVVIPGSGYDGSGPALTPNGAPVAATDGSIWAYATSMVHLRLGPVATIPGSMGGAMDRTTNTVTFWAQRVYVAGWDCCHFAAPIDLALCVTSS